MKLLFETPVMHRAGTWFRAFYLARGLARRGHAVTVVKVSPENRVLPAAHEEDGVTVLETPRLWGGRFSRGGTRLPSDLVTRGLHLASTAYDVVHAFAHQWNSLGVSLLSRAIPWQGRVVADWDDLWTDGGLLGTRPAAAVAGALYDLDAWAERDWKRGASGVTVVSEYLRNRAILDGVPPNRIVYLPNGAPTEEFSPGDKGAMREHLGLTGDRPLAAFVGFGQYDLDLAFDAIRILDGRGRAPMLAVTGPHADQVEAWARERGIAHLVRVLGMVPFATMKNLLLASDVGLMPYADKPLNRARFPIKIGDYIAARLPIAGNSVGEVGRIIDAYRLGIAAAPNANAFADAIQEVLTGDPARFEPGLKRAAEELSWDAVARQAEVFYEQILA